MRALVGLLLIGICLYGAVLAVRLIFKGEWQWFCLPFIIIPLAAAGIIANRMLPLAIMRPDAGRAAIFESFCVLCVIALLSGCCVYWLLRRYRRETSFVYFYAAAYFFNAFALAGCAVEVFIKGNADIFIFLLVITAFYAFIVTLAGVKAMRSRIKRHKERCLKMTHK